MNLLRLLWFLKSRDKESVKVIRELHHAEAERLRARRDLRRAQAAEQSAHEIYECSVELRNRNGFAQMLLETFDLRD